jgi:hypothetical protein
MPMTRVLLVTAALAALTAPALADNYPVSGRWSPSASSEQGAIDCSGKRVIAFNGDQRTDSNGGVPAYRNKSVTGSGTARWRIVDIFTTGQISNAYATYTLQKVDADHLEMNMQPGGILKLQRCK